MAMEMILFWSGLLVSGAAVLWYLRKECMAAEPLKSAGMKTGAAITASGWLAIWTVLLAVFHSPVPDANDDAALNWILGGLAQPAKGPYIHPFYGRALDVIYDWIPGVNWFVVSQYAGMLLALWMVLYMILRLWPREKALTLTVLTVAGTWCGALHQVTFTRTAGIMAISGGLLFVYALRKKGKERTVAAVCGALVYFWGWMVRWESACLTIPFIGMAVVWKGLIQYKREKKPFKAAPLLCVFCLIAAAGCLHITGQLCLKQNPEWKDFLAFDEARATIVDYAVYPDWDACKDEYAEQGFGWQEADLVYNWLTEDTERLSTERIQKLAEMSVSKGAFQSWSGQLIGLVGKSGLSWCTLAVGAAVVMFCKKTVWLPLLGCLGGTGACVLLFLMQGRVNTRAFDAMLFCGMFTLLLMAADYSLHDKKYMKNRAMLGVAALVAAGAVWTHQGSFAVPNRNYLCRDDMLQIAQSIHEDTEHVYILPMTYKFSLVDSCGMWDCLPKDYCSNLIWLSGWETRVPEVQTVRKKIGVANPMRALMEDPRVKTLFHRKIMEYLKYNYHWFLTVSRTPWEAIGLDYGWYTLPQQPTQAAEGWNIRLDTVQPDVEPMPADGTKGLHLAGQILVPEGNGLGVVEYYLNVAYPEDDAFSSIALKAEQDGSFDLLACNVYDFETALQSGHVSLVGRAEDGTVLDLGPVMSKAAE